MSSADHACPGCFSLASVMAVPAAYEAALLSVSLTSKVGAAVSHGSPHSSQPSLPVGDIAAALRPAPERLRILRPERVGGTLLGRLTGFAVLGGLIVLRFAALPIVAALLAATVGVLVGLRVYLLLWRMRRNARVDRGQPMAVAVWSTAWLCRRCAGVFVPPECAQLTTPHPLLGGLVDIRDFQRVIWKIGRYDDLLRTDWREDPRL